MNGANAMGFLRSAYAPVEMTERGRVEMTTGEMVEMTEKDEISRLRSK